MAAVAAVFGRPAPAAGDLVESDDGQWQAEMPRTVDGDPVLGDGTFITLYADGSFLGYHYLWRTLEPRPARVLTEAEAEAAYARAQRDASIPPFVVARANLIWAPPSATPAATLRLCWVLYLQPAGGAAGASSRRSSWLPARAPCCRAIPRRDHAFERVASPSASICGPVVGLARADEDGRRHERGGGGHPDRVQPGCRLTGRGGQPTQGGGRDVGADDGVAAGHRHPEGAGPGNPAEDAIARSGRWHSQCDEGHAATPDDDPHEPDQEDPRPVRHE